MGKLGGFKEFERADEKNVTVKERVKHYKEFTIPLSERDLRNQGSRCMDCGIAFCHSGCPLGNLIPEFNDRVYNNQWKEALDILHSTNNFPEFTGRLCPAPCEKSCVLGIVSNPVSIENIEKQIVERGFAEGWVTPKSPKRRTGKKVAVIGSGPAGMAAAQQLNRAGHMVIVYERNNQVGGLLRYGIPNFKLEKEIIDRRVEILRLEGITFRTNSEVGKNVSVEELAKYHAIVLCAGATKARGLNCPGADNKNVVQAMTYLTNQTKALYGEEISETINANGKHVIVIGGGDTGSDCVGTANRQGAASVTNFEIMHKPPFYRSEETPWPYWPFQLTTSSSHEEGVERNWQVLTKEFIIDEEGNLEGLLTVEVEVKKVDGKLNFVEKEGTEKVWPCDLAILALGFEGPEKTLGEQLGLHLDHRGTYVTENYQSSVSNLFVAGDMRRGQSLIVWAISEGREAAREIDQFLMGETNLPTKGPGDLPTC